MIILFLLKCLMLFAFYNPFLWTNIRLPVKANFSGNGNLSGWFLSTKILIPDFIEIIRTFSEKSRIYIFIMYQSINIAYIFILLSYTFANTGMLVISILCRLNSDTTININYSVILAYFIIYFYYYYYYWLIIWLVFTFFQKKGRVGMIKKGTFVRKKGTLVR